MSSKKLLSALLVLSLAPGAWAANPLSLPEYIEGLAPAKADAHVAYGSAPSQWADLYLPQGAGPFPVAVIVHGGCWSAAIGAETASQMAADLAAHGVAAWNIEYRRLGEPGGGYPGMYLDVGAAFDRLRDEAKVHPLDLSRVIAVGHSSGGHLALWAASRSRLPASSALRVASPLPVTAVVSIAGVGDLTANAQLLPMVCGEAKIEDVVGPASAQRPDPFADTSPRALLPTGVRTLSINGVYDDILPPYTALWWRMAAVKRGDPAENIVLPDAGHFDVVAVQTPTWTVVRDRVLGEVVKSQH